MNTTADHEASSPPLQRRMRFELIFNSILLAAGFFVLPALIYTVGALLLGPYGQNAGLGSFYATFFKDLVEPAGRAWILALGPWVLVSILRLIFRNFKAPPDREDEAAEDQPSPAPTPPRTRIEPRVSTE